MKKSILLALSLISFALSPIQANAQEAFTINDFHSDITIHEDSSFEVTETIAVEFSSGQTRHLQGSRYTDHSGGSQKCLK